MTIPSRNISRGYCCLILTLYFDLHITLVIINKNQGSDIQRMCYTNRAYSYYLLEFFLYQGFY